MRHDNDVQCVTFPGMHTSASTHNLEYLTLWLFRISVNSEKGKGWKQGYHVGGRSQYLVQKRPHVHVYQSLWM